MKAPKLCNIQITDISNTIKRRQKTIDKLYKTIDVFNDYVMWDEFYIDSDIDQDNVNADNMIKAIEKCIEINSIQLERLQKKLLKDLK
jgi:hypothetical protein